MRRRIIIAALSTLALLLALGPPGSASAATANQDQFCVVRPGGAGQILKPGQRCHFLPVATRGFSVYFDAPSGGATSGGICGAITAYPPLDSNMPLNDNGGPGQWDCWPATQLGPGHYGALSRTVHNGFGAIYGVATIVNFSNTTIRFVSQQRGCSDGSNRNCVYYYT